MYYLGIDIGGTKTAIVVSDTQFNIIKKLKYDTDQNISGDILTEQIADKSIEFLEELNIELSEVKSVGVSCGGPLDSKLGKIISTPNIPKWHGTNIKNILEQKLGLTTFVLNDGNSCAVAEWKMGAGKGTKNMIFLTFGTGFGAGLILNGSLYEGANFQAGEIGHLRLTEDGPYAYGKNGSVESYCSGAGITQLMLRELKNKDMNSHNTSKINDYEIADINTKLIFELANSGDEFCLEVIKISAKKLALTLSFIIDFINPELIVIGSIYERNYKLFNRLMAKTLEEECLEINLSACKIKPSLLSDSLGDIASIITATGEF